MFITAVFYSELPMILLDGSRSRSTSSWRSPTRRTGRRSRRTRRAASTPRAPSSTAAPRATTPVYGINTGFGALAETAIPRDALGALQLNLLRSHAAGVGAPLPVARRCARRWRCAPTCWRRASPASGATTLEALLALLNRRVHPRVPSRGSVGASGDLAPLAHLALVLDRRRRGDRRRRPGVRAGRRRRSRAAGLAPVALGPRRARAHQRHAAVDGGRRAGAGRRRAAGARRRHRRRAVDRRAARLDPAVRRAHPRRRGRIAGRRRRPPTSGGCSTAAPSTRRTRTAAGCRTPTRCAARRRSTARRATRSPSSRARSCHRSQRRDRQPDGLRRRRRDRLGRQLPRRAGRHRRRSAGDRAGAARDDQRAASDRLVNPALSDLPAFLTAHSGLQSGYMIAQVTAAALDLGDQDARASRRASTRSRRRRTAKTTSA